MPNRGVGWRGPRLGDLREDEARQMRACGYRASTRWSSGRSPILGKPIGMLLLARDATVTYCHSHTENLPSIVRGADTVVAAVGRGRFVRGDWLKQGAVVIDAGYDGNVGDVDFDEAVGIASLLTRVPGGVGPMTIAVLLDQTIVAAQSHVRNAARGSMGS